MAEIEDVAGRGPEGLDHPPCGGTHLRRRCEECDRIEVALKRKAARRVIDAFGAAPGHVFNLGHGILQKTPIDSVAALVDEVRTYSRALRQKSAAKA